DPVDSQYGDRFDFTVDAIQRAAETQEYVLDRFWFPWEKVRSKEATPTSAGKGRAELAARHKEQPGVLLFRNNKVGSWRYKTLLVIFLVGETPTKGIHKVAFSACLDLITRSKDFRKGPKPATIQVLGPYFSGSN